MSCVTCHMSCVMCHMSHVICQVPQLKKNMFFLQKVWARRWRVCYQVRLLRLRYFLYLRLPRIPLFSTLRRGGGDGAGVGQTRGLTLNRQTAGGLICIYQRTSGHFNTLTCSMKEWRKAWSMTSWMSWRVDCFDDDMTLIAVFYVREILSVGPQLGSVEQCSCPVNYGVGKGLIWW